MSTGRKIIHLDLDAFFCAVEELRDASLVGKAFAVGGRPDQRGVVSSCSYAARAYGVRSAMPMAQALKLCPNLILVSPHFKAYSLASRQVMARLRALTPLIEQLSIDEAFLDVSALPQDVENIALELQQSIRDELSLPCSIGVASNKLVAKIATEVGKQQARSSGPPAAIRIVPEGQEAQFLAPLKVDMLWGVGPKTAARLAEMGVKTIGDLASVPAEELAKRFGKSGWELAQRSRGLDERPVVTERQAKSISQEVTFSRDIAARQELLRTLDRLSQQVAQRLQKHALSGVTVKLKLRWPDFTTLTRQITLAQATHDGAQIGAVARELFEKVWRPGRAVRLLGVGVSGLSEKPLQLGLWDAQLEKERRLQDTVDELKARFGGKTLSIGLPPSPDEADSDRD